MFFFSIKDHSSADVQAQPESSVFKHKKNFKIWFSPRSRKVRCMVDKRSESTVPENGLSGGTVAAQPDTSSSQLGDLSVFNFMSSSQDSRSQKSKNENRNRKKGSTKKNTVKREMSVQRATKNTRRKNKEIMKMNRLEAINQQWGFSEGVDPINQKQQPSPERAKRSSKRVSFLSPAVMSDEPQPEIQQESTNDLSPGSSAIRENLSDDKTQPGSTPDRFTQHDKLSTHSPNSNNNPDHDKISPLNHSSKRCKVEEKATTLETTPKRPRASPRRRRSQMSPAVLNPPSSTSPRCERSIRNSRQEQEGSPTVRDTVARKSPRSRTASVARPTSGSPTALKRNHKGETLLHIASIKVEEFKNN